MWAHAYERRSQRRMFDVFIILCLLTLRQGLLLNPKLEVSASLASQLTPTISLSLLLSTGVATTMGFFLSAMDLSSAPHA